MATWPWWDRSSPWIGLAGGLLIGFFHHLGLGGRWTWWVEASGVAALFDAAWPLGYLVLASTGFAVGWVFRRFERPTA